MLKRFAVPAIVTVGVAALLTILFLLWRLDSVRNDLDNANGDKTRAEAEVKQLRADIARQQEVDEATEDIETEFQEVKTEKIYVDREVTKTVYKYRDRVVDRFFMPADWVHAYNLSVRSVRSLHPSTGVDEPSGSVRNIVDDATALEVIASNNRACVDTMERFISLQQWADMVGRKSSER